MSTNLKLHVAEIVQDELKERKWDVTTLLLESGLRPTSKSWDKYKSRWEKFLSYPEKVYPLKEQMAGQLASALKVDAGFWMALDAGWREENQECPQELLSA